MNASATQSRNNEMPSRQEIEAWRNLLQVSVAEPQSACQRLCIDNPHALVLYDYYVRKCVDILGQHRAKTTTLFLWGLREPSVPWGTKIGGLPYFDTKARWPRRFGTHCRYLAQICFLGSEHLFDKKLPGDVLLIFTRDTIDQLTIDDDAFFCFEWVSLGSVSALHTVNNYPLATDAVFFGSPYQVLEIEDFTIAEAEKCLKQLGITSNELLPEFHANFRHSFGAKIGGNSLSLDGPRKGIRNRPPDAGAFLFSLLEFYPYLGNDFALVNIPSLAPPTHQGDFTGYFMMIANFALNFYISPEGKISHEIF
ncbi:hypothetical protein Psta_3702 [Pirellula staleyi DSM 6068]|uniref:Uncharacterized protein n=1 Tax=Pirellula staleyi (strain ATCC 27377 / DSM 6068 / ICPB 4128) TaxID=530564 RepID=D2QZZ4_PIRSD|nr:hypothetical protein [Pirellula staleyi]ADB18359.1 hypothetical protein Psta_3702 [Pirellula staleyi DSM 6068]